MSTAAFGQLVPFFLTLYCSDSWSSPFSFLTSKRDILGFCICRLLAYQTLPEYLWPRFVNILGSASGCDHACPSATPADTRGRHVGEQDVIPPLLETLSQSHFIYLFFPVKLETNCTLHVIGILLTSEFSLQVFFLPSFFLF